MYKYFVVIDDHKPFEVNLEKMRDILKYVRHNDISWRYKLKWTRELDRSMDLDVDCFNFYFHIRNEDYVQYIKDCWFNIPEWFKDIN